MKKILALVALGLVTLGIVAWLANYLSTGTITITGKKSDTITLQKTSSGKPFIKIATGNLDISVKHGQYTATIKNGSKTAIQIINFNNGHKTFRYSLSPSSLLRAEPVAYVNAQALEATPNQLIYLNGSDQTLYEIGSQNSIEQISSRQFRAVKWANPSFGVGQGGDGVLYTITGNSINPLKTPFSYGGKAVNFDVSPSKNIYVSYGADVYAGDQAGSYSKIYTASSSKPALAAGDSGVAVSDSKYGANGSNIPKPLLMTMGVSGKKSKKNIEAERMAWSPNGQYLVTVNQSSPTIFDSTLKQVAVIPTSAVVGQFAWLNNTTLLYATSNGLWSYDASSQTIRLFADTSFMDSINGLYVSGDEAYVYITTVNSISDTYSIKRLGLKDQSVPDYVYKLGDVLPENLSGYYIRLVNFSLPPTILAQPYVNAPAANYTQKAQAELQNLGFNTSQLHFQQGQPVSSN